jgi:predicted RNA-binding protein YlxR (DUF448 family)
MAVRKIPMRMCLGCGENKPKRELIRVVKSRENIYSVDFTGKKNGRGAYICPNMECFNRARKAKRFERAFEGPIPNEIYEKLLEELTAHEG